MLADVKAPWDPSSGDAEAEGMVASLREGAQAFAYLFQHGLYWAPQSLDSWKYRLYLKDLDAVCLRTLQTHGALSARDLAEWLNRESLLRTKPEKTGIRVITVATTHDWLTLAHRRGLVDPFSARLGPATGAAYSRRWSLTEHGRDEVRSRLLTFIARMPIVQVIGGLLSLAYGGGLIAAIKWLSLHEVVLVILAIALGIALYLGAISFYLNRTQKKEGPGLAVVAIETLRSAGKPVPAL